MNNPKMNVFVTIYDNYPVTNRDLSPSIRKVNCQIHNGVIND